MMQWASQVSTRAFGLQAYNQDAGPYDSLSVSAAET